MKTTQRRKRQSAPEEAVSLDSTTTIFSSDLLTPEEERELLATFWENKSELVKVLIRHFPRLRRIARHPGAVADGPVHPRLLRRRNPRGSRRPPGPRPLHPLQAPARLGQHPPRGPRRQAVPPSRPGLCRPPAGSRLRPDAGHRSLRRQPRHAAGDLRDLVDSPDAADRGGPPEPPGQPVAAPPARAGPVAARVRGVGPRRQAPAQPPGTRPANRQQSGAPDPSADRHAHAGVAQRRPGRRQRFQAHRGDAGQREPDRCGRTPSGRRPCIS